MRESADVIEERACGWVSRVDRGLDTQEQTALSAWLAADSRHSGAFARAQAMWRDLDRAQVFQIAEDLRRDPETAIASRSSLAEHRKVAVRWAAAALVLVTAGLGGWYLYPRNALSTEPGEVRQVPLPDGSRVVLDAGSRIKVEFEPSTRLIKLESGQALFEVAKDTARPFIVDAAQYHVRAVGTAFLVRIESASQAQVTVTKGTVEVWSDSDPHRRRLTAGGHVELDRGTMKAPEELTPKEVERLTDWRSGLIDLTGKTLAQAVSEMNRYNGIQLEVLDPRLASETLLGTVSDSDPEAFAEATAAMLDAQVRRDGNRLILERVAKK
jgi:transmembrane sensor